MITISLYRLFFACATNIRHSVMYFFCFSVYNQKAGAETTPLQYCHMKKRREIFVEQGGFQFSERRVLNVRKARKIENNTVIRKFIQLFI